MGLGFVRITIASGIPPEGAALLQALQFMKFRNLVNKIMFTNA